MRLILMTGVALALSACSGTETTAVNNTASVENATVIDGAITDPMTNVDGNVAADANTQALMEQDATTNDPDTNLANGI